MTASFEIGPRYDALVVGARCAGAATAMLLAREGLRVLAIDRSSYGSDTLSTHALMRGAVLQLHRWNLLPRVAASGTPRVPVVSFQYGDRRVRVPIKPSDGVDALYAPRRTVLDRILVDGAREAGADVAYGVRLTALERDARGRVTGAVIAGAGTQPRRIAADVVIGADGLRSTVASLVNAPVYRRGSHASAVLYGYWRGLDVPGYEWLYNPGVSAGVIPTTGGETCVFASMPADRFQRDRTRDLTQLYHRVIDECSPALAASLQGAAAPLALHGFPGQIGFFRRSAGPGWALVGDAGYFKDPLTAHGITDALRDAELLATAVVRGTDSALDDYQRMRDELALPQFIATDRIASFEWDLDTVQTLHRTMSEEMGREVRAIRGFHPARRPVVNTSLIPVRQSA